MKKASKKAVTPSGKTDIGTSVSSNVKASKGKVVKTNEIGDRPKDKPTNG